MAGDFSTAETGNTGKKHSNLKSGVRIDMTPMVDVIMLLLTFFMLTTTLSLPQAMNINLPKGEKEDVVPVNMGNVLYIRVSESGNVFFSKGLENGTEAAPEKVNILNMSNKLEQLSKANEDLLLLLKFDRNAKYKSMVDVLDEVNNSIVKKNRRFTIMKMEESDKEILRKAEG